MREIGDDLSPGSPDPPGYSGSLLLAHPALQDPNFKSTVVLLSAHTPQDGALGVVLNRPLGKTLAQHDPEFALSALADMPLYSGGPVSTGEMILAAWKWTGDGSTFRLYFGLTPERACELVQEDPGLALRGFMGYSGWSEGQLEGEVEQNAWVISPMIGSEMADIPEEDLWRHLLLRHKPELLFLSDTPDDPSVN